MAPLQTPVEHYLNHGFVMFVGDVDQNWVISQVWPVFRAEAISLLETTRSTDRRECNWADVLGQQEPNKLELGALWVEFDLVAYRLDLAI